MADLIAKCGSAEFNRRVNLLKTIKAMWMRNETVEVWNPTAPESEEETFLDDMQLPSYLPSPFSTPVLSALGSTLVLKPTFSFLKLVLTNIFHQATGTAAQPSVTGTCPTMPTTTNLQVLRPSSLRLVVFSTGQRICLLTMGRKCYVPRCNASYKSCQQKFSLFSAPKDEAHLKLWKHAIPHIDRVFQASDHV